VTSIIDTSSTKLIYTRVDNARRLQGGTGSAGVKVEFIAQLPASSSSALSTLSKTISDSSFGSSVSTNIKTLSSSSTILAAAFNSATVSTSTITGGTPSGGTSGGDGGGGGGGGAVGGVIGALIVIGGLFGVAHYMGYTKNIPILKNIPPFPSTMPSLPFMKKQSNVLTSTPPSDVDSSVSENAVDVVVSPLQTAKAQSHDEKTEKAEKSPVEKTPGIVVRKTFAPIETEQSHEIKTNKPVKKKAMSELQASTLIQSRYKSFKVRSTLKGWTKVVDDDGDVYFRNEETGDTEWNLPSIPFHPNVEENNAEEEREGYTEVDDDGVTWNLDGPGGARLQQGWKREEDESDVWYVHEDGESAWDPPLA